MIDKNGKIKGRVSIIDIVIVLAVLALAAGFIYRQTSERLGVIFRADETFYITVETNRLRSLNVDAIEVGDVMFRMDNRQPFGIVREIQTAPATNTIGHSDGTITEAEMEGRYLLTLVLESTGSITPTGYFINGIDHVAPGSDIILVSNRILLPVIQVRYINTERP